MLAVANKSSENTRVWPTREINYSRHKTRIHWREKKQKWWIIIFVNQYRFLVIKNRGIATAYFQENAQKLRLMMQLENYIENSMPIRLGILSRMHVLIYSKLLFFLAELEKKKILFFYFVLFLVFVFSHVQRN